MRTAMLHSLLTAPSSGKTWRTRVELYQGVQAVRGLATAWRELERAADHCTPFQTWQWTRAWLRTLRPQGAEPLALLARNEDGEALALMPLQRDRHAGMRRLIWLGTPTLQYGGLLMRPMPRREARSVVEALWDVLRDLRADYVDLPLMTWLDPGMELLTERERETPHNFSWRVDLSTFADWRAFELALKPSARRARKKRLNRLLREGEVAFVVREAQAAPTELLDTALEWKRGWLRAQGLMDSEPMREEFAPFLHALAVAETRVENTAHGRWLMAELRLDGKPLAVDFGMVLNGVFHSFFAAYDPDHAHRSPGKVALWLTLRWCMENGISSYDMLANPAPYKQDWANMEVPLWRTVRPLGASGVAYRLWARRFSRRARQMHAALPAPVKSLVRKALAPLRSGHGA